MLYKKNKGAMISIILYKYICIPYYVWFFFIIFKSYTWENVWIYGTCMVFKRGAQISFVLLSESIFLVRVFKILYMQTAYNI